MQKKVLLTEKGLLELQNELNVLKSEERIKVAEQLKEAISYGDLSENAEYQEARDLQAKIELRISELEEIVKNHEIIKTDTGKGKKKKANIGSKITIVAIDENKKEVGENITYSIVGSTESNLFENKISNESPVGTSLIWKIVGDIAKWKAPKGDFSYKILEVK